MFRTNGGLIGNYRPPTIGAAPGIWSAIEQVNAKRGKFWPSDDPYFDKVSLLMHMEGENNSTNFIDSSFNNLTITPTGDSKIITSSKKFGSSCAIFDGAGDYLTINSNSLFDFGGGINFTVELWLRINTFVLQARGLIGQAISLGSYAPFLLGIGNRNLHYYIGNVSLGGWALSGNTSGSLLTENNWHHIALVGNSGTITIYVNGSSVASVAQPSWSQTPRPIYIAINSLNTLSANCEIDEIRITKGIARYTSNFAVPTAQFSDA